MTWTLFTRFDHDRSGQRYTHVMTDREFAPIAPRLPAQPGRRCKRRAELRALVDGISDLLRSGRPGADLAKDFPPKITVYWYFRHFREDRTRARIQDRDGAARLFEHLAARFPVLEAIIGDGGYAGPILREAAPGPVEIVTRSDQARGFGVLLKRTLAWLTINRRLARGIERHTPTAPAYVRITMSKLMSRRLARYSYS